MKFKKRVACLLIAVTSANYAMSKLEVVDFINHHSTPAIKLHSSKQTNTLHWESLKGPMVTGSIHTVKDQYHPNTLYVYNADNPLMFKSLDSGLTWQTISLPTNISVTDLLPIDVNQLILATTKGIFSSKGIHFSLDRKKISELL